MVWWWWWLEQVVGFFFGIGWGSLVVGEMICNYAGK